jgi:hypothetical protein
MLPHKMHWRERPTPDPFDCQCSSLLKGKALGESAIPASLESAIEGEIKREFRRQGQEAIRQFASTGFVDMAAIGFNPSKKLESILKNAWIKQATDRLKELAKQRGAKKVSSVGSSFDVIRKQVEKRLLKQLQSLSQSTLDTTQKSVDDALKKARAALIQEQVYGENTVASLTKAVQGVFEDAEKWRAKRIAVTESSMAVHDADILAATTSNVVRGFELLVSADACEICQAKKGTFVSLSQAEGLMGNYDNRDLPPIHVNCRCSQRAVLITDMTPYPAKE